jgi:protein-S-isoprenylcysteine O-methyltransferase Ste14
MSFMTIIQIVLFLAVSIVFFLYSRPYLKDPRRHGFYRFFGWELTLFLVVINLRVWFNDPLAPLQILSWILLLLAILLAVIGFLQLHSYGKAEGSFENTTKLVEKGLYKTIRHPLYGSLILGTWGAALKQPDLLSVIVAAAATLCYFLTAKVEEEEMVEKFGEEYKAYMRRTKLFVPYVF